MVPVSPADRRPEPQISPSIEVLKVSIKEFCDQLAIDETRFIGLQHMHESRMIWLLLEMNDDDTAKRDIPPTQ